MFLVMALTVWLNEPMIHLEFKESQANLPGRLGSVHYQEFWLAGHKLRIDFGSDTSKILDLQSGEETLLDHLAQTYVKGAAAQDEEDLMQFNKAEPFEREWNGIPCTVYQYVQPAGEVPYQVEIWFGEVGDEAWKPLIDYALGMARSSVFRDDTPQGFPVRVRVAVTIEKQLEEAMELAFLGQDKVAFDPSLFKIPPKYQPAATE